jgi:hypothetical protein
LNIPTFRFIDPIWLLILAAYILAGAPLVPFHGDEATQIYMSRDYSYQFIERDLNRVLYSQPPVSAQEQHLRLLNGTVNKYLIGLAWHLGGFTVTDVNEQWDWGADWNYNQTTGHAPSAELLMISRWPSAGLLALGLLPMFLLGKKLGGRPAAYLAALLYALHPALLINGRRAMMEGSFITFSLFVVLFAVWLLDARSGRGKLVAAVGLGIAAGLALASKHTALFAVAGVYAGLGVLLAWVAVRNASSDEIRVGTEKNVGGIGPRHAVPLQKHVPRHFLNDINPWHLISLTLTSALLAALTFVALNPAWWGDLAARTGEVLRLRQELLAGQTAAFGGYADWGERLAGFARQTFAALPQYYEIPAWQEYIGDQIARYEASGLAGIGGSVLFGVIVFVLTLLGLWALWQDKQRSIAARWIIAVWALTALAAVLLLTPIEWARYYLPAIPAAILLASLGIGWVIRQLRMAR